MKIILALLPIIALTACTTAQDDSYGAGFVTVSEKTWGANHTTPYPFTVSEGEISCGIGKFGREVYFEPEGFTDESYIGTPLNKIAANSLERDGMSSNVPYSVKKGADLHEAVEIGLRVCDEQRDIINSS